MSYFLFGHGIAGSFGIGRVSHEGKYTVIAEFGKDHGLVDCNMKDEEHPATLCNSGSNLIRSFFEDSILYRYDQYASGMREQLKLDLDQDPDTFESIWLIEPDFYQYSESASLQKAEFNGDVQEGGGIPDAEMGGYFSKIVSIIKYYLPAAKIAIDISPWISDWKGLSQAAWYANFDMSLVDYASTSGGGTFAGGENAPAGTFVKEGNKILYRYAPRGMVFSLR